MSITHQVRVLACYMYSILFLSYLTFKRGSLNLQAHLHNAMAYHAKQRLRQLFESICRIPILAQLKIYESTLSKFLSETGFFSFFLSTVNIGKNCVCPYLAITSVLSVSITKLENIKLHCLLEYKLVKKFLAFHLAIQGKTEFHLPTLLKLLTNY